MRRSIETFESVISSSSQPRQLELCLCHLCICGSIYPHRGSVEMVASKAKTIRSLNLYVLLQYFTRKYSIYSCEQLFNLTSRQITLDPKMCLTQSKLSIMIMKHTNIFSSIQTFCQVQKTLND